MWLAVGELVLTADLIDRRHGTSPRAPTIPRPHLPRRGRKPTIKPHGGAHRRANPPTFMARKSFYIIDGHAHIYRAYFAPFRDLTSPTGEPTKATFVFTQMLLNLIDQRKPDYLAMVIDSGDETVFRKEFFPEYKRNRTAPPDDFRPQEQRILQIVRDAGVPI